jgi:hypothetical protein
VQALHRPGYRRIKERRELIGARAFHPHLHLGTGMGQLHQQDAPDSSVLRMSRLGCLVLTEHDVNLPLAA